MTLAERVNAHILGLRPYEPGKPVEELERELGIAGSVKLASNENPVGPSPKALAAVRGVLEGVNRYPDGACFELRTRMAEKLAVDREQLIFGCGADEILGLLAKSFLSRGDEVVHAWPSFAMYPIVVAGMGAESVAVPLDSNLVHDLPAMAEAIGERTKIVFVCNPNNPTGTSVGTEALDDFVKQLPDDVVLAVDEAYAEYARRPDFPDVLEWLRQRPGTVVLRTFSKIYGLAGMRIGYAIADPELAGYLERARHPFNVNGLAEVAALAALDDREHVERCLELNAQGIEYLSRELPKLDIEIWPSDANFILARAGADCYQRLLREGIIVRPLQGFGLPDYVRITVGLPEQNERLVKVLERLREAGP